MKQVLAGLTLGVLLQVPAVHAATTIDAAGFSLTYTGQSQEPFDMELLSATETSVSIRMDAPPLSIGIGESTFVGAVRQGYRITSVSFSAQLAGELSVGMPPPGCPAEACITDAGRATNEGLIWAILGAPGATDQYITKSARDIDGTGDIEASDATALLGDFSLSLTTEVMSYATPTVQTLIYRDYDIYRNFESYASLQMSDLIMTVNVAAVPEPSTYAMLLAGLGVAGWAARRRTRA